jgi:glycosyltransferase involved in cell wall biosynthesis
MIKRSAVQISVALVTRNRPQSLNDCLVSLRDQASQPFEIIVSDDSDELTQQETRRIAERWRCIYVEGPRRGLYANRNHAASFCRGTHVRTMDDDHRFPSGHIKNCYEAVCSDPDSIWTTGETSFIEGQFYGSFPTANQLHASGLGHAVADKDNNWAVADGSTIYPAKVFEQGHRMVEWYSYGPSYLEFGAYLYKHGFKSRCVPDTTVEHYADQGTLLRMKDLESIMCQLFTSLCFNLYFQRNQLLATKYLAACLVQARFDAKFIKAVPTAFSRGRQRWLTTRTSI